MIIQTKFDTGEEMYILWDNKIRLVHVDKIEVYHMKGTEIYYYFDNGQIEFDSIGNAKPSLSRISEKQCFSTKEELVENLLKQQNGK